MTRLRLGLALTLLAGCAGIAQSAPTYEPQAEVLNRLAPALATQDPARLTMAFRAMGEYGTPAADIVEATVNSMGYQRLQNDEVEAAIVIFELNSETFPESSNVWDSLAQAVMADGDQEMAIRYYRRSLEFEPDNRNAARMIQHIMGESRLSHAGGSKERI